MIRLEAVIKTFKRQRVLDGLSLTIRDTDRVALIGSNGAGKTTLIRCLLGEYTYEGTVTVDGLSPRDNRREVLGRIGFVPQLPPPLKMPVGELVRFAAAVSGIAPDAIVAIMEQLGLPFADVRSKPFVKLSGGQKQKILAAIALGRPTRLLVLDEPTANLDPAARISLFRMLAERAGQPVIISSHRLEEVAGLVNRVIELDRGRVVLDDRVEDSNDPDSPLRCAVSISRAEPAFAHTIVEWGFTGSRDGRDWHGQVAGPDRLRFLGTLARYAGLLTSLQLDKEQPASGSASPSVKSPQECRDAHDHRA